MKRVALVSRVLWGYEALRIMCRFRPELDIGAVLTLPEKESRRHSNFVSFEDICSRFQIPLVETLNINRERDRLMSFELDYLFIFGWSQLVGEEILGISRFGCIGSHPTMLPKDRGRGPVTWQLIRGYTRSAMTLFFIDSGVDSGDIISQHAIELHLDDTAASFYKKIIETGKKQLTEIIPDLLKDNLLRKPQDHSKASYLPRRRPEDGIIDWALDAFAIYNWVRGLTRPFPGAFTFLKGRKLLVWRAQIADYMETTEPSGKIILIDERGILAATSKGHIYLSEVQFENQSGIAELSGKDFGQFVGEVLGK